MRWQLTSGGALLVAMAACLALVKSHPARAIGDPPAGECAAGESLTTSFGHDVDVSVELNEARRLANKFVPTSGYSVKSIRLQLRSSPPPSATWRLEIRDPQLRLLASISAKDLRGAEGHALWTGRFDVSQLNAELIGAQADDTISIDRALIYDEPGTGGSLFSIQGAVPNWRDLYSQQNLALAKAGDSVGMMVARAVDTQFQAQSWCCSGSMVAPGLFLTNWHCGGTKGVRREDFWNKATCASTLIDLAWDKGTRNRQYRCEAVVATDESLDYALLRVTPTKGRGGDDIPVQPVAIGPSLPPIGSSITIIHHPTCLPKMVSVDNCRISAENLDSWRPNAGGTRAKSDLSHTCDTEAGSSGAPIFSQDGKLVALHHLGFEMDNQCHAIKRENRAIAISAILAGVRNRAPADYQRIMDAQR